MIISIWVLLISFIKYSIHSYNIQTSKKLFNKKIDLKPINSNKLFSLNKSQNNSYKNNQINLLSEFNNNKLMENIENVYIKNIIDKTIEIENDTKYNFIIYYSSYYYRYVYYAILESSKNVPFYDKDNKYLGEMYITKSKETIHINPQNFSEIVKVRYELSSYNSMVPLLKSIYNNQDKIYEFFADRGSINNYDYGINISQIIAFRNNEDYIFYINTIIGKLNVWFLKYNKGIYVYDIIKINKTYFKKLNDSILNLEKDNFYIFVMENLTNYTSGEYSIIPINIENIFIENNSQNILYLKENKKYNITFKDNSRKRLIKLSESTLNSTIKVTIDNKEIIINKNNPYFEIGNNTHIILKSENSNGLIKFLYDYSNIPQINSKYYNMIDNAVIIKCENLLKNSGKIRLLFSNVSVVENLNIISGYSKLPYMSYYEIKKKISFKSVKMFYFELNIPQKELLVENETFNILISSSEINDGVEIYLSYQNEYKNNIYPLIVLLIMIIFIITFLITLSYYPFRENDKNNKEKTNKSELILK